MARPFAGCAVGFLHFLKHRAAWFSGGGLRAFFGDSDLVELPPDGTFLLPGFLQNLPQAGGEYRPAGG